jgi:hypothetical protein
MQDYTLASNNKEGKRWDKNCVHDSILLSSSRYQRIMIPIQQDK